jgi:hypothetical protein
MQRMVRCDWTPVRVWYRAPSVTQPRQVFSLAGLFRLPAGPASRLFVICLFYVRQYPRLIHERLGR